jgi:cyclic-di-GMP phosphodiesterase TipF (flagellum assembly factor)
MTEQDTLRQQRVSSGGPHAGSALADLFVIVAMAIVCLALAAGLVVQAQVPLWSATAAALVAFGLAAAGHALLRMPEPRRIKRRRTTPRPESSSSASPGSAEVMAEKALSGGTDSSAEDLATASRPASSATAEPLSPHETEAPERGAAEHGLGAEPVAGGYAVAESRDFSARDRAPELNPPPQPETMQAYWSYAPGMPRFEPAGDQESARASDALSLNTGRARAGTVEPPPLDEPAHAPLTGMTAELDDVRGAGAMSPREADVELIQSLIKKLADEVNAAEAAAEQSEAPVQHPRAHYAAHGRAADDCNTLEAQVRPGVEAAVEASVEALRVTAASMRAAMPEREMAPDLSLEEASARSKFSPALSAMPPPIPPPLPQQAARDRMAALREAVARGRMDVLLEPILGLNDQRARHYEVTLRLRAGSGEVLSLEDDKSEIRGTGLLPLVDAARFARTAGVAARLGERGKAGSVFSSYSGESLTDGGFLSDIAALLRQRPGSAGQLVLTFSQEDVRAFRGAEGAALADLVRLGFRFALAGVTDLDMDFEALVRAGFLFAKLDADVFLEGLHSPAGLIPASDICRHLAGLGLTLVVDRIDDELKLARIFGFGALYGQGQLFGVPRPVKADAIAGHRDAAA